MVLGRHGDDPRAGLLSDNIVAFGEEVFDLIGRLLPFKDVDDGTFLVGNHSGSTRISFHLKLVGKMGVVKGEGLINNTLGHINQNFSEHFKSF